MSRLTKQEQMVICVMIGLLLIGWAVKAWRTAHAAPQPVPISVTNQDHATARLR